MNADDVRALAARYGLNLDRETATERAATIAETLERFADLRSSEPESAPALEVRDGDDPHNAFYKRCVLDAGDGPLDDLDIAVKDNLAVSGVPMTCGSAAFSAAPTANATVVERLVDAGGTMIGTTNMDEFALWTTGETCTHGRIDNPAAPGRVAGGSSSGSAAAVAAGLTDAALGTDTGGSIRIPASYCGVVGLKPTHRTVPRYGFVDLAPSLDHIGPLATDVKTVARIYDAIAGPDPHDPSSHASRPDMDTARAVGASVDGMTVGLVESSLDAANDAVSERVRTIIDGLPVDVERVAVPTSRALLAQSCIIGTEFATLVADEGHVYGTGTGYSEELRRAFADLDADGLGENVRRRLLAGAGVRETGGSRQYVAAQNERREFLERSRAALSSCDALVTPTTPTTALEPGDVVPGDDGQLTTLANAAPWNLTGQPALSVPCGKIDGRPVGLQVTAEWYDEATAVALGSAVERMG